LSPARPAPGAPRSRRRAPLTASAPAPARAPGAATPWVAGVALAPVRTVAALAGAVLALSSTGDPLVAAVVLGVAAGRVLSGLAVALAAVAVTAWWGSADLAVVAGGQSVLGPAGLLEPARSAAVAWLAAAAVVVAWPGGVPPLLPPALGAGVARGTAWSAPMAADLVGALFVGALAAALVWGPDAQGAVLERAVATAVGAAAALGMVVLRRSERADRAAGTLAVVLGAGAVVLALAERAGVPSSPEGGAVAPTLAAATVAAVLAAAGLRWGGRLGWVVHPVVVLGLWALAALLGRDLVPASSLPVPQTGGLPGAGWLLAGAAAVGLVAGWRWSLVTALPGAAAVVHALLAGSAPAGPAVALAVLAAVTVVALLARVAGRGPGAPDLSVPPPVAQGARAAAVVLALAPLPGGWAGVEGLEQWRRGVGVALAAALATMAWVLAARWRASGGWTRRG
jgi:hypothetical protein